MAENKALSGMDMNALASVPLTIDLARRIIAGIQQKIYGDTPINSMDPFREPQKVVKENGQYMVTEIRYGDTYMNSFLDITYPTSDIGFKRPTVIYTHGGGFFGGNKTLGDPLAVGDPSNFLFEMIVEIGYNFVNVDYVLTPEGYFPSPLIQLNQAIDFLAEHAEEYGLDMNNVVVFGSSAGAILTAQYGVLLVNPEYQKALGIFPKIDLQSVKALIVDDAALLPETFNWGLKVILGNYCNTLDFESETFKNYNAYNWFTPDMAPAFFDAGTIDGFPADMLACGEKLKDLGVETEVYIPQGELPHGFLNLAKENEESAEGVRRILAFMDRHTK